MKRNLAGYCTLLLIHLHLVGTVHAAAGDTGWQDCAEMQGEIPAASELDCYRQVAQRVAPTENFTENLTEKQKNSIMPLRAGMLTQEWGPSNAPLNVYKQSYVLLYARSLQPNNNPDSPNPQNQVVTPYPLDNKDLKFQFSVKHDLVDFGRYGSMWLGYTQLSFWQMYDYTNSRPFRENNYEPEFIYSIRPNELTGDLKLNPSVFNIGLVHQSNGQPNPRSRSWNRIYIQPGVERFYGSDRRLVLLLRWWQRIKEESATDDNPDITDYLGHGEIEIRYTQKNRWEFYAIAKKRSFQLDFAAPWTSWRLLTLASPGKHNTNVHLQYFSGYGESLIDYNQSHKSWGLGLSFPFD